MKTLESKIIDIIKSSKKVNKLNNGIYLYTLYDVGLELYWTFWDDDIDERTDDNGYDFEIDYLEVSCDNRLYVSFYRPFGRSNYFVRCDYMDESEQFMEFIYDNLCDAENLD